MFIPKLSETSLQRNAAPQAFQRGKVCYDAGAVVSLTARGGTLQAQVEGNEAEPYRVNLSFDDGGLTASHCSCDDNFEGWCEHIIATLLVCRHQAQKIQQRPTLEHLLDQLDLTQTRRLVQALLAEQPALLDRIDDQVSLLAQPFAVQQAASSAAKPVRHTALDPAPFRREVREILRHAVEGWESGWDDDSITQDLQALIDKAQDFTRPETPLTPCWRWRRSARPAWITGTRSATMVSIAMRRLNGWIGPGPKRF